jgi:DNA-binding transcriptional LysR family regulator
VEVGQAFLACALVNAGAGIAVVDELVIGNLRRGLVVRPFRPQKVVRLYALARPERLSLAAQALLDALAPPGKAKRSDGTKGTSTPKTVKRTPPAR